MKKVLVILLALALCAGLATATRADTEACASCHVFVTVDPNVGVQPLLSSVDAGSVQTGDFSATCIFRVDANKQEVTFQVEASDLYKANDPTGSEVAPIPLNLSAGVEVKPVNGNATGGATNILAYTDETATCNGFPTLKTVQQEYSSSQNNHFSQDVSVKVTWNQDDPERPTGEYSGCVKLCAFLEPDNGQTP